MSTCIKQPSCHQSHEFLLTGGHYKLLAEINAENSYWSFLHYFQPAFSVHMFERSPILLNLYGCLIQVLLWFYKSDVIWENLAYGEANSDFLDQPFPYFHIYKLFLNCKEKWFLQNDAHM